MIARILFHGAVVAASILLAASGNFVLAASAPHVLNGELVITDPVHSRFRIVGYDGIYSAPAGVSLEPFDGKPVAVTLGTKRTVVDIVEKPIDVKPIEHGYEEVSGYLQVVDDTIFRFAGGAASYRAPAGSHFQSYQNQLVRIRIVDGKVTDIRALADAGAQLPVAPPNPPEDAPASAPVNMPARAPVIPNEAAAPLSRNCAVGELEVINGSSICQQGKIVRCANGVWQDLGIPCH